MLDAFASSIRVDETRGSTIGPYRILGRVGAGTHVEEFRARDEMLARQVIVRVMPAAPDRATKVRARREAFTLARMDQPAVEAVQSAGEVNGRVWIAAATPPGVPLREWAQAQDDPDEVMAMLRAAAHGLAAAHREGVVHRGLGPRRVLADGRGHVVVDGFVCVDWPGRGLRGMPGYLAPEQLDGAEATRRSDQFAFCVLAWEALFGEHPFAPVADLAELYQRVKFGRMPTPRDDRGLPKRVVEALSRGMSVDPKLRWPTLDALAVPLSITRRRFFGFGSTTLRAARLEPTRR